MATAALLAAKPFTSIANSLSPVTGYRINNNSLVLAHTGNTDNKGETPYLQYIKTLKNSSANLLLYTQVIPHRFIQIIMFMMPPFMQVKDVPCRRMITRSFIKVILKQVSLRPIINPQQPTVSMHLPYILKKKKTATWWYAFLSWGISQKQV